MDRILCGAAAVSAAALLFEPSAPLAHGFAGERFFPATILTDDPFVADEESLPTFALDPTAEDGTREIDLGADLAKRITPDFGITIDGAWQRLKSPGLPALSGFGGLSTGAQYQIFIDPAHEAMALVGVDVNWAHTGNAAVGAPDFTTVSPTFDFGKGFGDLPDSVRWLRPLALTGNLGFDFPTRAESGGQPNPTVFNYGFAVEYSLEYLQHFVKDVGLRTPYDRLIPLVEFALSTPVNRVSGGTTGTVQPGVIWAGQYFQVGGEMIIPTNRLSGHGIGGVVQLHFYLDDLFPKSFGRPVSQW